jgi:hypothetical protein
MIDVRNSSYIRTTKKWAIMQSLFVFRFFSEVSTTDIEKSLLDQLKLSSLACTRLKREFQTYTFFTFQLMRKISPPSIRREYAPKAAPFYGNLNPDQIHSSPKALPEAISRMEIRTENYIPKLILQVASSSVTIHI